MSKRVNVMLSDRLNLKLDSLSESYGVSKSSIVGFVVGQWIDSMEKANSVIYGKDDTNGAIFDFMKTLSKSILVNNPSDANEG